MKIFDDLIQSYLFTKLDDRTVDAWYQRYAPDDEALSALAEHIGDCFLAEQLNFDAANGLLNHLMVLASYETAPKRFWEYFIAFEEYEVSENPDSDARPAVAALKTGGAA